MKKIIIFGTGSFAKIALRYFNEENTVLAFTVDREYWKEKEVYGVPVIPFDEIEKIYPPSNYEMFVAMVCGNLNRERAAICERAKQKGYKLARYISPHAFVHNTAEIGEHAFVFEGNIIQPFVKIGGNVIIWSGDHIGHESVIDDDNFISSHCVISGHCHIKSNCFIGVNSAIGDRVVIGHDSWVSPGAIITKDIPPHSLVKSVKSEVVSLDEGRLFG